MHAIWLQEGKQQSKHFTRVIALRTCNVTLSFCPSIHPSLRPLASLSVSFLRILRNNYNFGYVVGTQSLFQLKFSSLTCMYNLAIHYIIVTLIIMVVCRLIVLKSGFGPESADSNLVLAVFDLNLDSDLP